MRNLKLMQPVNKDGFLYHCLWESGLIDGDKSLALHKAIRMLDSNMECSDNDSVVFYTSLVGKFQDAFYSCFEEVCVDHADSCCCYEHEVNEGEWDENCELESDVECDLFVNTYTKYNGEEFRLNDASEEFVALMSELFPLAEYVSVEDITNNYFSPMGKVTIQL